MSVKIIYKDVDQTITDAMIKSIRDVTLTNHKNNMPASVDQLRWHMEHSRKCPEIDYIEITQTCPRDRNVKIKREENTIRLTQIRSPECTADIYIEIEDVRLFSEALRAFANQEGLKLEEINSPGEKQK